MLDKAVQTLIDATADRVANELDKREQARIMFGHPNRTHGARGVPQRSCQPIHQMPEHALATTRLECIRLALDIATKREGADTSTNQIVIDAGAIAEFVLDGMLPG